MKKVPRRAKMRFLAILTSCFLQWSWDTCGASCSSSTSVEAHSWENSVCVCPSIVQKLWYFLSFVFSETWSEVRGQLVTKTDTARFSGKNPDHSIITIQCLKQPFFKVFQLWADFDGNLSHWWSLFMLQYDRTFIFEQPRENRMSRKILLEFLEFLTCDA